MGYLGEAYKEAGVQVGDKAVVMTSSSNEKEYIITVISPEKAKTKSKNISVDGDFYVYGIIVESYGYYLKIGYCDGWNPKYVKPLSYENKTDNFLNNCPECNILGEYINGAYKCPNCWKVW